MEESRDLLFCHVTDHGRDLRYVIKNTEMTILVISIRLKRIQRLDIPDFLDHVIDT